MKKLIPLLFLVACADPNAELLAKYKNLELDYNAINLQFETLKRDYEQWSLVVNNQLSQCRSNLKYYVCKNKKRTDIEFRVLCGGHVIVSLPDSGVEE